MKEDRFHRAFREWAARPPRTPAPFAARRLAQRLAGLSGETARQPRRWALSRLAGAAAVLAVLAGGLWLGSRPPLIPRPPQSSAAAPVDDGVVVLWLDTETPLYLTLNPPPAGG